MSRWRCIRCETFNESDRKKCIVCDLERKDETAKVKKKPIIINTCAFPGCVDKRKKIVIIVLSIKAKCVRCVNLI